MDVVFALLPAEESGDSNAQTPYQRVDGLQWTECERHAGNGFQRLCQAPEERGMLKTGCQNDGRVEWKRVGVYQVKHSLFSEYLRHQLKSPAIQMKLA